VEREGRNPAVNRRQAEKSRLGLEDSGGAVRVGIAVHYNTADEVDRLLSELETV